MVGLHALKQQESADATSACNAGWGGAGCCTSCRFGDPPASVIVSASRSLRSATHLTCGRDTCRSATDQSWRLTGGPPEHPPLVAYTIFICFDGFGRKMSSCCGFGHTYSATPPGPSKYDSSHEGCQSRASEGPGASGGSLASSRAPGVPPGPPADRGSWGATRGAWRDSMGSRCATREVGAPQECPYVRVPF